MCASSLAALAKFLQVWDALPSITNPFLVVTGEKVRWLTHCLCLLLKTSKQWGPASPGRAAAGAGVPSTRRGSSMPSALCTPCAQDAVVPAENAYRLAERVPTARLHTFAGWGHGFKKPAELAEVRLVVLDCGGTYFSCCPS